MSNTTLPPEYPSWSTFVSLRDLNLTRLKEMLDGLGTNGSDEAEAMVLTFYREFMDEDKIEATAMSSPLFADLHETAFVLSVADPVAAVSHLHLNFATVLFGLYSSPDKKDSASTIATLSQGGLGLPDRDYYTEESRQEKRDKYIEYITALFTLVGKYGAATFPEYATFEACTAAAQAVFAMEMELAQSHFTRTQCRDPHATYNKMTMDELGALCCGGFDFKRYFELMGKPVPAVNVAMPDALKKAAELTKSPAFPHYLIFHVVTSVAKHLPREFVTAHFDFFQKCLSGTAELKPRWKQAMDHIDAAIGDLVAKIYVRKFFSEQAKTQALEIVGTIQQALRDRLGEITWMSAATRVHALKKLDSFTVKIGYPDADAWTDYTGVKLTDSHLANVMEGRRNLLKLDLARMNAPTDRGRWHMHAHQVNAYYHPMLNEIVFPSAILQPPFFDINADLAVQYGSFGCVVAHEITHGFDDQGRKYDSMGNMVDWWTEADAAEYERRKQVMVDQASSHEVHGVKLNGNLTCGENIADLGGIILSLRALKARLNAMPAQPLINAFTPIQRFFLSWSTTWRAVEKEEYQKQMLTVDPHGPKG